VATENYFEIFVENSTDPKNYLENSLENYPTRSTAP
jgi:hypothetical protein